MRIQIKKQIGTAVFTFDIEEAKTIDALFTAGSLATTPDKCSLCGSNDVELQGSKAKGFTFVKVACKKCGAKAGLGQYKDSGFFWKQFEKQDYVQDDQGNV
jgi:hypothetical protein